MPQTRNSENNMIETEDLVEIRREESRKTWDHHCSYQWTYFPEEAKRLIQFFLSKRIHGKNLDVGAGWYLYHPDSTAIDLSPKGLEYNPAKEKILFDLDDVGRGKQLPFPDKSYNSATLVSVWQYLKNRKFLLSELERVLTPGSEVFIINQGGSGLTERCVGPMSPQQIEQEVTDSGYDCIRETIPFGEPKNPFQSVTVAMPDFDLFGRQPLLRDRAKRINESKRRATEPEEFYDEFALWETQRAALAFQRLGNYPITKYSRDYLKRLQRFSQTLKQKTGKTALIFLEHGIKPEIDMMIPSNGPSITLVALPDIREPGFGGDDVRETMQEYGIKLCQHLGYMGARSIKELRDKTERFFDEPEWQEDRWEFNLEQYVCFLASEPLNEAMRRIQLETYDTILEGVKDLEIRVRNSKYWNIYFAGHEYKQRRTITELVATKEKIEAEGIPIVGHAHLNYLEAMDYYMERARKGMSETSRYWPPPLSDD